MILVVGATGQLGSAVVRKLTGQAKPVRALARHTSRYQQLVREDVDLVFGDLRDQQSLDAACQNVDTIIATANAAVPTNKHDTFESVDGWGYENLIRSALRANVRQFVYTSVLEHPYLDRIPLGARKRVTESSIRRSGLEYTIFRADAFMDVTFPMMGTDLPLRGAEAATVERSFWFTSRFFNGVRGGMSKKGTIGILGDGNTKHSYVCIDDLAEFLVNSVDHPDARNKTFDIGGPAALTQNDVRVIFESILGHPLKPKYTPAVVFRIGYQMLRFVSPAAANIMGLNYHSAVNSSIVGMSETAKLFGVRLTSAEEFLRQKATATEGLPKVRER